MSEWAPLSLLRAWHPRKYSDPPAGGSLESVRGLALIGEGDFYPPYGSSASFAVIDDPGRAGVSRPMSIGVRVPLFLNAASTGSVTVRLHPTPARNSGVFARIVSGVRSVQPEQPIEEYNSVYLENRGKMFSGYEENLPLEQAYWLPDSFVGNFQFGYNNDGKFWYGYVNYFAYLEFGVIGGPQPQKISLEVGKLAGVLDAQLELAVFQPPGSQSPVAVVGDLSRPLNWNHSFECPMSFIPQGHIAPRSFGSISLESPPASESEPYTVVPYRGPINQVGVPLSRMQIDSTSVWRRSVEFDQGPCVYGESRAWAFSDRYVGETTKPGNNATARAVAVYPLNPPQITDEHRKKQTVGLFGWPVTPSQNRWPMFGSQYGGKLAVNFTHLAQPGYNVGLRGYQFELGDEDFEGNKLCANTAAARETDVGEVLHSTGFIPSNDSLSAQWAFASAQNIISMLASPATRPNSFSASSYGWHLASEAEANIAAIVAANEAGEGNYFLEQRDEDIILDRWCGACAFSFIQLSSTGVVVQLDARDVPSVTYGTATSAGMGFASQGGTLRVQSWKDRVRVAGTLQSITKTIAKKKKLWYYSGWQIDQGSPPWWSGSPTVYVYPTSYTSVEIEDGRTTRFTNEHISFGAELTAQQLSQLRSTGSVTLSRSNWEAPVPIYNYITTSGLYRGDFDSYPALYGSNWILDASIELRFLDD